MTIASSGGNDNPPHEKVLRASQDYFRTLRHLESRGHHKSAVKLRSCWNRSSVSPKAIRGHCGSRLCPLCAPRYWRKRARSILKRLGTPTHVLWMTLTVPPDQHLNHSPLQVLENLRLLRSHLLPLLPPGASLFLFPHFSGKSHRGYHPHYNMLVLNASEVDSGFLEVEGLSCLALPPSSHSHSISVPPQQLKKVVHYIVRPEPDPVDRWMWTPRNSRMGTVAHNQGPRGLRNRLSGGFSTPPVRNRPLRNRLLVSKCPTYQEKVSSTGFLSG